MALVTVDVVLELSAEQRDLALSTSAFLVERMAAAGHPSAFQLGHGFPADIDGGVCEPHVSLFMLQVDEEQIPEAVRVVGAVAAKASVLPAEADSYRPNPWGAPELHFRPTPEWVAIQCAVVAAMEPLRQGRLRDTDPAGARLADVVARLRRDEPSSAALRQLLRYGYDEITDDEADRFAPHVTLAWPADSVGVDVSGLPPAHQFTGVLTEIALYGMRPNGTCTKRYGGSSLGVGFPDQV